MVINHSLFIIRIFNMLHLTEQMLDDYNTNEISILKKAKQGDAHSNQLICARYTNMVYERAYKAHIYAINVDLSDLQQECYIELLKCIKEYDMQVTYSFAAYLWPRLRSKMQRILRSMYAPCRYSKTLPIQNEVIKDDKEYIHNMISIADLYLIIKQAKLTRYQKDIVMLTYKGFNATEIAKILNKHNKD